MANDLNQCNFIGRLGRDPELRHFASGDAVANVSIAVGSTWKDKNGEKQERTEWIPLVFAGKLAEIAAEYLRKGSQVFVSGEFRTRKWTDKDGQDRYATEVRVNNMQMLGSRQESGGDGYDAPRAPAPAPRQQQRAPAPANRGGFEDMDDDIPFIDPMKRRAFALAI